ncbi:cofactor-independent phosphoglycerate mutase [Fumia xinanensis]|uniref:Cofactor-independent phosphoglycerate mutase n=1 Tax=Fumia xinanensis TaxID=2763659 RepID=A0A926E419_9FIRM|nr:cofactor-independent phosphoglycerate mutase [Fumia xinanensis]MBC8559115.1 cofactor-independent phosphoglycerate mutase [Fumia xinanensis]
MKYLVLLCDGMADTPVPELDGKTPMEAAHKPNMDALARESFVGLAKTVPDGMKPGSDVANLSAMGYNPADCYTGRSPLEAASIGIDLKPNDYAIRCNLVTLSDAENYADKTMVDYCADDISTEEADELVCFLQQHLPEGISLHTGVSYRHCLVWDNMSPNIGELTPPHDISGRKVTEYLPDPDKAGVLLDLMKKSYDLLKDHPVNIARVARGKRPANSMWLWGQGRKAQLEAFEEKNGVKGAVISAVDLIKGIGILAHMDVIEVEGSTGYIDTNFDGKAAACIGAFEKNDLVYVHVEAPDECGHRGEVHNKVRSIEIIDEKILGPVKAALDQMGPHRIMILPDHPTPLAIKTHSSDPVPYLIYNSEKVCDGVDVFTEATAKATGNYLDKGYELMNELTCK